MNTNNINTRNNKEFEKESIEVLTETVRRQTIINNITKYLFKNH